VVPHDRSYSSYNEDIINITDVVGASENSPHPVGPWIMRFCNESADESTNERADESIIQRIRLRTNRLFCRRRYRPTKVPTNPPAMLPTSQLTNTRKLSPTNCTILRLKKLPSDQRTDECNNECTDESTGNAAYKSSNECAYTFSHQSSNFPTDERTNGSRNQPRKAPTNPPTKEPTKVPTKEPTILPTKVPINPPTTPPISQSTNAATLVAPIISLPNFPPVGLAVAFPPRNRSRALKITDECADE
jgi:hypothetical protein